MKTLYVGFFAVFAFVYLAYITWLTGYRAGYDEGASTAWMNARRALAPRIIESDDLLSVQAASPQIRPASETAHSHDPHAAD